MNPSFSFSSTPFRFDEAITDPTLRGAGEIGDALDKIVALAHRQRTALLTGKGHIEFPEFGPFRQFGHLLARAAIAGQVEAAEAMGMFWINGQQDMDNTLVGQAYDTLAADGRLDLMRPIMALMHDLCTRVWNARADRVDVSAFTLDNRAYNPEQLPDRRCLPLAVQVKIIERQHVGSRGAWAWWELCDGLADQVRPKNSSPSARVLQSINDVMTSIPDAAQSAERAVRIACQWQGDEVWKDPRWNEQLGTLITAMTDAEACGVLRRLADLVSLYSTESGQAGPGLRRWTKLAQTLIDSHPKNSLEDWLWNKVPLAIEQQEGLGWEDMRKELADNEFDPNDVHLPAHRLASMTQTYEIVVGWVGARRGAEMSGRSRRVLGELVAYVSEKLGESSPTLQAALDLADLTEAVRLAPSGEIPDEVAPTGSAPRKKRSGRM